MWPNNKALIAPKSPAIATNSLPELWNPGPLWAADISPHGLPIQLAARDLTIADGIPISYFSRIPGAGRHGRAILSPSVSACQYTEIARSASKTLEKPPFCEL